MCEFCEKLEITIGDMEYKGYTLELDSKQNEIMLWSYDDFITSFKIDFCPICGRKL